MQLTDHQTGLAGRLLLEFTKPGGESLPMNRLKVGSPVIVSDNDNAKDNGVTGVVSRRKANLIQVATDTWPEGSITKRRVIFPCRVGSFLSARL